MSLLQWSFDFFVTCGKFLILLSSFQFACLWFLLSWLKRTVNWTKGFLNMTNAWLKEWQTRKKSLYRCVDHLSEKPFMTHTIATQLHRILCTLHICTVILPCKWWSETAVLFQCAITSVTGHCTKLLNETIALRWKISLLFSQGTEESSLYYIGNKQFHPSLLSVFFSLP